MKWKGGRGDADKDKIRETTEMNRNSAAAQYQKEEHKKDLYAISTLYIHMIVLAARE